MNKYNLHPHIPPWLVAANGELLSSTDLDILDFIHWCWRFGCRTSNDRIGSFTHHTHATVQRSIAKQYALDLVTIENYGKRSRCIRPILWPDRQTWESYRDCQDKIIGHPAHFAPHISPSRNLPTVNYSKGEGNEPSPPKESSKRQGASPPTPPCGSVGKVELCYQMKALAHRDKIQYAGRTRAQANHLALVKYPDAKFD